MTKRNEINIYYNCSILIFQTKKNPLILFRFHFSNKKKITSFEMDRVKFIRRSNFIILIRRGFRQLSLRVGRSKMKIKDPIKTKRKN